MPEFPLVSVIVPHLDDVERLGTCIAALEKQSLPRDAYEIIVADNGSRCGLAAVARAAGGARVIAVAERGAGPARNAGIAVARGRILAFTDSDCVPHGRWLAAGIAALETADLAGGGVEVSVANPAAPTPSEAFELVFAFDNRRYVETRGFSVTANLLARRWVAEAIGGFKVGVPEDLDWCRRATRAGARLVYAPDALVTHPARPTFEALAHKWRRLTQEAHADWLAGGGSRAGWLLRAAAVLLSALGHTPRVLTSPRLERLHWRLGAWSTLVAIRILRARWMLAQAMTRAPHRSASAAGEPAPGRQAGRAS